jgi:hypothetical protein
MIDLNYTICDYLSTRNSTESVELSFGNTVQIFYWIFELNKVCVATDSYMSSQLYMGLSMFSKDQ